jgi:hypothetical protein
MRKAAIRESGIWDLESQSIWESGICCDEQRSAGGAGFSRPEATASVTPDFRFQISVALRFQIPDP